MPRVASPSSASAAGPSLPMLIASLPNVFRVASILAESEASFSASPPIAPAAATAPRATPPASLPRLPKALPAVPAVLEAWSFMLKTIVSARLLAMRPHFRFLAAAAFAANRAPISSARSAGASRYSHHVQPIISITSIALPYRLSVTCAGFPL